MEEFVGGRNRISTSGFIRMRNTIPCRGLIGIGTKDVFMRAIFAHTSMINVETHIDRCRMTKVCCLYGFLKV